MAKKKADVESEVRSAVMEAKEAAMAVGGTLGRLKKLASDGELTFGRLREDMPSTKNAATPPEHVVRAFGKEPDLIVAKKEFENDESLTVFTNGFYTYTRNGWSTILRVDGFERIYFEVAEGRFDTLPVEEYKDCQYSYPLGENGEWNLKRNEERRYAYHVRGSLDEILLNQKDNADPDDFVESLIEIEEKGEKIAKLYKAMDVLTEKQRRVIKLHYMTGMTVDVISKNLGLDASAIRRLIKRGLERMKKFF